MHCKFCSGALITNIDLAHFPMMGRRMVLREVVGQVVGAFLPVDAEVALADSVADPIKAHVYGFGSTLFDFVVDDAFGNGIVSLDWSGRLGVA